MSRRNLALILAALLAAAGCSVDTELGGVAVPNARPDSRITGQPPTLLEAGFMVEFNWTGSDPDGRVVGFQWKLSDNGVDGISPRDTLTHDPLTGAEMNPWRFTAATDTTFVVLADQADFPGDSAQPRSFRTHSLFIRSVDDKGAVDPTPAYMTFTSTTLVPTARASFPGLGTSGPSTVPPTVNIGWEGTDPDFELRIPTKVRYLWKRAQFPDGRDVRTPNDYNQVYEELIDFDDPEWTVWQRYAPSADNRLASFERQVNNTYWLFAVQTQDTAGAVSVGRRYGGEVAHVLVKVGSVRPVVSVREPFLGTESGSYKAYEIAAGQPLNFSWTASAAAYNGKIVSYRHGWDLISVDDPNDPGWAVPPGTSEQNRRAVERSFQDGVHSFWLRVEDDSQQVTKIERRLNVVPYVDYDAQSELLVLDQVVDNLVQNWQDIQGVPRNDQQYRNEYWSFLQSQPGGVNGLDWNLDRKDHSADINYADLVPYKAVLCYAQYNDRQLMMQKFRPVGDVDKYVWLIPYQERGGNFFLVGGGSLDSFLQVEPNYMTPIIFDTREETYVANNVVVHRGLRHQGAVRRHGGPARTAAVRLPGGRRLGPRLDLGQHQVRLWPDPRHHEPGAAQRLRGHQGHRPGSGFPRQLADRARRGGRHHGHQPDDRLAGCLLRSRGHPGHHPQHVPVPQRRVRQRQHQQPGDPVRAPAVPGHPGRAGGPVHRAHVPRHRPLRLAAREEVGRRRDGLAG